MCDALEIEKHRLTEDSNLGERTKLTVDQITEGMQLCLNMSYFTFQSRLYTQELGLAMGSPISHVLANLYMEDFETKALTDSCSSPKIWWRYVDDILVIIKRDKKDEFLNRLNTLWNWNLAMEHCHSLT
ncbi:unnamed protein product, partial [Dicrocoelium dendriticum]